MKPLTSDELWLLDQKVAEGESIKLWLVWDDPQRHITAIRATPGKLLYVSDDLKPIENFELARTPSYLNIFTNYWHAYAFSLRAKR